MTVLRGPSDADHYRVKVGRYGDRWYTDPLPSCPIAEASDWQGPSWSIVKGAAGKDWSYVTNKRNGHTPSSELHRIADLEPDERTQAFNAINKNGLTQAGGRGTIVHLWAEDLLAGRGPRIITDPTLFALKLPRAALDEATEYLEALAAFFDHYQPEVIAAEYVALHRTLNGVGYGCTPDVVARVQGQVVGIDWKGLALDTPIPTPRGWTMMGRLKVGQPIYGANGHPTRVVAKSEVRYMPCYRIVFDDTSELVADGDHRWPVMYGHSNHVIKAVMTTAEVAALRAQGVVVRMPLAAPVQGTEIGLPIDPYLLGVWLGDGSARDGTITKPNPDLWAELERRGHKISKEYAGHNGTHNVYGLAAKLERLGVRHNKHVPESYLHASISQRLDLLRGLMDTDGTWNTVRKQAAFEVTSKPLALAVQELVCSLGWRCSMYEGPAVGFGLTVWRYRVSFRPFNHSPFLVRDVPVDIAPPNSRCRYVRLVDRTVDVATQCIAVDAPDELYLVGPQFAVTHNTRGADSDHGAYPEEAAQIAAGARAEYMIITDPLGAPIRAPLPDIDCGIVVSIKPDGCRIYPTDIDKGFAHVEAMHAFWTARLTERDAVGKPWPPTPTKETTWTTSPSKTNSPDSTNSTATSTPSKPTSAKSSTRSTTSSSPTDDFAVTSKILADAMLEWSPELRQYLKDWWPADTPNPGAIRRGEAIWTSEQLKAIETLCDLGDAPFWQPATPVTRSGAA